MSALVTVSHSVQVDAESPETGVAYGAPGIPMVWPIGNLLSSLALTAAGLAGLPSTSRAEVRL